MGRQKEEIKDGTSTGSHLWQVISPFIFSCFAPMCLPLGCASWLRFCEPCQHHPLPTSCQQHKLLFPGENTALDPSSPQGLVPGTEVKTPGSFPIWEIQGKSRMGKPVTNSLAPQPCCSLHCVHTRPLVSLLILRKEIIN